MNLSSPISIYAVIFYSLQFICGIPGNILIIVVYMRKKRKISTDVLIIAQGIIDLAASLLAPVNIVKSVSDTYTTRIICRITLFGNNSLAFASLFLTAAIAFDRFFFVCRPYGKKTSNKRAVCLGATCWVLGSSLTCTKLIFVEAVESIRGELTCLVVDTRHVLDTLEAWLKTSGFVFALVTSSVMYGKIYYTIRQQAKVHAQLVGGVPNKEKILTSSGGGVSASSKDQTTESDPANMTVQSVYVTSDPASNQQGNNDGTSPNLDKSNLQVTSVSGSISSSNGQDQRSNLKPILTGSKPKAVTFEQTRPRPKLSDRGENRTTKMLMAVTIILLASWLPPIVFFHLRDSTLEIIELSVTADTLVYIGKRLPGINHIINYFVYTFMNKRFRLDCKRLFRSSATAR